MSILFKNCDILIGNPSSGYKVIKDGYLGISGKDIDYVGHSRPSGETAVYSIEKDMGGALLMPGLINCHCHAPMTLLRGVGSDLPLQEWLFGKIIPIEVKMTAEDIKAGNDVALLEMIGGGITSFSDMYEFPEVSAESVGLSGMKANLCKPLMCFDKDMKAEDFKRIGESEEFFKAYNGAYEGRVLVDLAVHSEYMSNADIVGKYAEIAKGLGGGVQVHLSETKSEHEECIERNGMTPAAWFGELGLFDSPTYCAHCVWCSDEDLEIFVQKGVTMVHNPSSNMKLASGFAPVPKALSMGINVTLGTDGTASNNNLNMLEEMHLASLLHKGYSADPTVVRPEDIIAMVTANGAKAQGRENCGEIAVGKRADIAAVSFEAPHMNPVIEVLPMLVYSAQSSDIIMTMVDGKILYEKGEYLTIDKERAIFNLKAAVKRLIG